ncbi:MAG: hypothetical protein V7641_1337 [Blastocatellia bacterium]
MFPKTQDQTIDRLLRAQGGGAGKASPLCREFDADLANAYVERSLPASETASFEQHLAACSPCRKSIIALTRMAQVDQVTARTDTAVGQTQESWIQRWRGALTTPRWAMAAAAAIVLAITLPLVLSRLSPRQDQAVALNGQSSSSPAVSSPASDLARGTAPGAAITASNSREPNAQGRATAAASEKPAPVAETKGEAPAAPPARDDADKTPAPSKPAEAPPADQVIAKNDSQTAAGAAAPATQPATDEAPLAKIDPDTAKKLPEDKDAAPAKTIKQGQTGGEERAKTTEAVRPDTYAPPPVHGPRTESSRQRRNEGVDTGVPGRAFQPSSEAVRAPHALSRKVGNHIFLLRSDVWTDKDYSSDKDMPVVIVIRDSDVYRSLLAKEEKIKPFLTGFTADQRVIFVFKGTVYKLIPQDGDR